MSLKFPFGLTDALYIVITKTLKRKSWSSFEYVGSNGKSILMICKYTSNDLIINKRLMISRNIKQNDNITKHYSRVTMWTIYMQRLIRFSKIKVTVYLKDASVLKDLHIREIFNFSLDSIVELYLIWIHMFIKNVR